MKQKIGVCLSGCGLFDGSEIHESVLTLLAIANAGAEAVCMAPNAAQSVVINHLTKHPVAGESRNVMVESARIARGAVRDLASVHAAGIDALIFPGGFGAVKNLSDYATAGLNMNVNPEVARLIKEMLQAGKPVGAICIAPVLLAAVVGRDLKLKPMLTIGDDAETAADLEAMGVRHIPCEVGDCVVDKANRLVTTPAYMLAQNIGEANAGIGKLVRAVVELIK
ncbi:MAG: isoprenoid biosynthesis glyoxalase ElbB [Candidatus Sumerlaeota bacterium]|nr:isoprenoid biosynthesis glyoxalase ElbB [Candidatus Sumerlaeota bacterium]